MTTNVVELQRKVFEEIDALCSSLDSGDWDKQTDCPGWSVKDNLSHIIGTEHAVLGHDAPAHNPGEKPWVRNPIGANNEVQVDYRRSWPPRKVLEEFREVTRERLAALEGADLDEESWTPIGQGTVRDLVAIRVMDCWVHEQDMRRAVGKPGNLDGPVAEHAFGRHSSAMGFVVGKKVGAPEGTTVVFEVEGMRAIPIGVEGRANVLDEAPTDPSVRLLMDMETFNCLCCGRGDPSELAKRVKVEGDTALGNQIVESMNFMI